MQPCFRTGERETRSQATILRILKIYCEKYLGIKQRSSPVYSECERWLFGGKNEREKPFDGWMEILSLISKFSSYDIICCKNILLTHVSHGN